MKYPVVRYDEESGMVGIQLCVWDSVTFLGAKEAALLIERLREVVEMLALPVEGPSALDVEVLESGSQKAKE